MRIDSTFTGILSDFFLDIAKAFFIATFVTPSLGGVSSWAEILFILTRGLFNAILFLVFAWYLAKLSKKYESS